MLVYPRIGHLTRRWFQIQRQATENRQGQRHDQFCAAGRISRTARLPRRGQPAVDPLANVSPPRRVDGQGIRAPERAGPGDPDRPVAAACQGKRRAERDRSSRQSRSRPRCASRPPAITGAGSFWAGPGPHPGVRQGPASVKLLHELLEQLAVMTPVSEGGLAELFDVMPPAALREALLVIISTRPINLIEEAERSSRFSGTSARGLLGRVMMLNATQGDLSPLVQFDDETARDLLQQRQSSAIQDRRSSQEQRRRGLSADDAGREAPGRPSTRETTGREQLPRLPRELLPDALRRHHGLERRQPRGTVCQAPGLVVAVAGAVAFYTVDRKQNPAAAASGQCRWPSPPWACSISSTGSTTTQRIPALAHWLVYLQLIKYFLPKTAEDDWFLFLLGLMQVLIGSVVNQSDQVGTWLFLWAMLAVWVLGQFFLQREALRFSGRSVARAMPDASGLAGNSRLLRRSLSGAI